MKTINKLLSKLLVLTLLVSAVMLFNVEEVAAAAQTSVEFINVATVANAGEGHKGDAILVRYNYKYFLVDTGHGYAYGQSNDPLTKKINELVANGKYLSGIIITHSHYDHMGALSKIIASNAVKKGSVASNGTTIYYNNTYVNGGMKTAIQAANNKGVTTQPVDAFKVYNASTGNKNSYETVKQNNGLYIYGSSVSLTSTDDYDVNQASMVVQLKSEKLNALLLGDLYLRGLRYMQEQYGQKIMGIDYDVCKIGHHGLRSSSHSLNNIANEYNEFYSKFKAEHYIFTTYKSRAESADFRENHLYLKGELDKIAKTYYSSSTIPVFEQKLFEMMNT